MRKLSKKKMGSYIKNVREKNNISLEKMANALFISPSTLWKYENGKRAIDLEMLGNISEYLGITIQEIYDASVEAEKSNELIKILGAIVILGLLGGSVFALSKHKSSWDYELIERFKNYDILTYNSYDSLYDSSKYIISGVIADTKQEMLDGSYINPINIGKIKIEKVYKGDLEENTYIELCQNYYFDENNMCIVTMSMATPMKKGEKWLFFIEEDLSGNLWLTGDWSGRYPMPECFDEVTINQIKNYSDINKNELLSKITKEQFGLYKSDAINLSLYSQIINKLDIPH